MREGRRIDVLFDLEHPTKRSVLETNITFGQLKAARTTSERDRISRDSGITCRSILFSLPSLVPFKSFPIDIMHLFYNVQNHLLTLHISSNFHEDFLFTKDRVEIMDEELSSFATGISGQMAPAPRVISKFKLWKAAEHKEFTISYLLILFDGELRTEYLDGLKLFVHLVDICYRPSLSLRETEDIGKLARRFIEYNERSYYGYDRSRVHPCKYVIHLLTHLEESVRYCGPLICNSQFWVEKYIRWKVNRCNARAKAGASMSRSAIFSEAYKIFYKERFHANDVMYDTVDANGGYEITGKLSRMNLCDLGSEESYLRNLVSDYLVRKIEGLSDDVANGAASRIVMSEFSQRIRFLNGSVVQTAVATTWNSARPSNYVAVEMENSDGIVHVYYGKLLYILRFDISNTSLEDTKLRSLHFDVAVLSWATGMKLGRQGQVYKNCSVGQFFRRSTMEDVTIIKRLVGVVERTVNIKTRPRSTAQTVRKRERRSYVIDPSMLSDGLQSQNSVGEDGVNRVLRGFEGEREL